MLTCYAILADLNLNVIDEKNFNFKPTKTNLEKYKDAEKIHGISWEMAISFPDKREELQNLYNFVGKENMFICHANQKNNSTFDFAFIYMESIFNGFENLFYSHFGTKAFSTHTIANKYADIFNLPKSDKGRYQLTLNKLCEFFNIDLNHHDAKSDCHACFELYKKMKNLKSKLLS